MGLRRITCGNGSQRQHARVARDVFLFALLLFPGSLVNAQTFQTLPEIDAYFELNSRVQVYVQAKETREGGAPTQVEFGPSIEVYLKPWIKLKRPTLFDLNEAKKRVLVFSAGYRYLPSPNAPTVNRLRLDLTSNFPVKANLLISDRNRADLDWQSGKFMWRYRNRLKIERRFTIGSFHPGPYVSAETFYQSQYQKWSTTALYAGCSLPLGKHVEVEPYYEHQNNTGKSPNQQLNQLGLILGLYF
jgi:Protein of unknown function (DUF2490)